MPLAIYIDRWLLRLEFINGTKGRSLGGGHHIFLIFEDGEEYEFSGFSPVSDSVKAKKPRQKSAKMKKPGASKPFEASVLPGLSGISSGSV